MELGAFKSIGPTKTPNFPKQIQNHKPNLSRGAKCPSYYSTVAHFFTLLLLQWSDQSHPSSTHQAFRPKLPPFTSPTSFPPHPNGQTHSPSRKLSPFLLTALIFHLSTKTPSFAELPSETQLESPSLLQH